MKQTTYIYNNCQVGWQRTKIQEQPGAEPIDGWFLTIMDAENQETHLLPFSDDARREFIRETMGGVVPASPADLSLVRRDQQGPAA